MIFDGASSAASPFGTLNGQLDDDFASALEDEFDMDEDLSPPELEELDDLPTPEESDPMPTELPEPEPEDAL